MVPDRDEPPPVAAGVAVERRFRRRQRGGGVESRPRGDRLSRAAPRKPARIPRRCIDVVARLVLEEILQRAELPVRDPFRVQRGHAQHQRDGAALRVADRLHPRDHLLRRRVHPAAVVERERGRAVRALPRDVAARRLDDAVPVVHVLARDDGNLLGRAVRVFHAIPERDGAGSAGPGDGVEEVEAADFRPDGNLAGLRREIRALPAGEHDRARCDAERHEAAPQLRAAGERREVVAPLVGPSALAVAVGFVR